MNAISKIEEAAERHAREVRMATSALQAAVEEFKIGQIASCQLGNPGDTDWTEETHANVPVIVIDKQRCTVTYQMYYLVAKVDDREYVGRASDARGKDSIEGELYCTNARRFGSKAQTWTGILTFQAAAHSLGFTLPIYDAEFNQQKLTDVLQLDAALTCLGDYFEKLMDEAEAENNAVLRQLWKHDYDQKDAIVRAIWQAS